MPIIDIDIFDPKSIDKAIECLDILSQNIGEVVSIFLHKCANKIVSIANGYLSNINISPSIKAEVESSWDISTSEYDPSSGSIKVEISNNGRHAVWLEYGTGFKGKENPYDIDRFNASSYQYDVNKHGQEGWEFRSKDTEIDVPTGNYTVIEGKKSFVIITNGYEGCLFAYNAMSDFMGNKIYQEIFEETLKEEGLV